MLWTLCTEPRSALGSNSPGLGARSGGRMVAQEGVVAGREAPEAEGAERRVFAVLGMRPEPGGYAVAKFSRSAKPYAEWAAELTQAGAERFYEAFYFQYGHASIADL